MNLIVHTDGGARGNPGPAAIGVVIEQTESSKPALPAGRQKTVTTFGSRIGETTNNVAEYTAVVEALKKIQQIGKPTESIFFLDSRLVVEQLNGRFKVKEPKLRELLTQIRVLEQEVGGVIHYNLVPRQQNRRADTLVNVALDSVLMS